MNDTTHFPDPAYRDTVLAPLFEGAKQHFAPAVRRINQAHLVMLTDTGILTQNDATEIAVALAAIDDELDLEAISYTGEHEDYFFLVEAELIRRLGPDIAGKLHTARSRNDMDHTVFKMALTDRLDALLDDGHALAQAMLETATRETRTLIVAYTHGQPAQPSTFGHYLAAASEVLLGDLDRLHQTRKALMLCPMGAAAITTTGFKIDRHQMADLLGFDAPKRNSYGCIASIDYVTGLYSAIKLLFLHLGRLTQDFQFWSAFEVGQLYVPNSFVQISSIMPQKRNPVPIEHLRLLSSLTVGGCDTIINTMHNTPFTDMNDSEGEVQQAGFAAFDRGTRVLQLMAAFIPALRINADAVTRNINASCITVTELADTLVRDESISFRQAHEIAAKTSKAVIAKGQGLAAEFDAFKDAFQTETGRGSKLDSKRFEQCVSAEYFVSVRSRFGGPAPEPLGAALADDKNRLKTMVSRHKEHAQQKTVAQTRCNQAFEHLKKQGNG